MISISMISLHFKITSAKLQPKGYFWFWNTRSRLFCVLEKKKEFSVFRTGVNCWLRNSKRDIRRTEVVVRTDDILPRVLENNVFKSVENSSHLNAETQSSVFVDQQMFQLSLLIQTSCN